MAKVDLYPDFRELLESLNSAGVKYLVLGGYAVIYYGYRRATDDLDIWITVEPENARKVSAVLRQFGGFPASKVKPSMFQERGKVFIFGREPVRVDILTAPSGLDFDTSYERRNTVDWDGVKVPLISFEDLRANKRASGRPKDIADLDGMPPTWPLESRSKRKRAPKRRRRTG
jgi:predicted nucleotidyltransferase